MEINKTAIKPDKVLTTTDRPTLPQRGKKSPLPIALSRRKR